MWLERALLALFPEWAAKRARARIIADHLTRNYEGTKTTRRTRGWRAPMAGPNETISQALPVLRARSRDLVRNNPWAAAALDMRVAYEVGYGIRVRCATGDSELDGRVDDLWRRWARACDVTGRLDFDGLTALACRSRAEAGEALALFVRPTAQEMRARNLPVPLLLQLLEPDHLDEPTRGIAQTNVVDGVELSPTGQPLAYWLTAQHPGEGATLFQRPQRYEAAQVVHMFRPLRAGQVRGVPDLAPIIMRLRGLDELEDAALETARVQACLAAFVTSDAPPYGGPLEARPDETGAAHKTFSPGMIERLLPGESVTIAMPSGSGPFEELARHQLHAIAAAFGLTYDLLTGDLAQANYSSLRAGRLAFKRRLEQHQWLVLVPQWCERIWREFIATAIAIGALPPREGGYPVEWGFPRFEMVDPLKDTQAMVNQVRAGFMTWAQAVQEMGYDPRTQADEIAAMNALLDDRGVILDSDPRRMTGAGGAHDPAQNAAIEIAATGAATEGTQA